MPSNERKYQDELRNLMDSLAESVFETSDTQIADDVRAVGEHPREAADRIREVLVRAVNAHKQQALDEARKQYEQQVKKLSDMPQKLPRSAEDKRLLLERLLTAQPQLQGALTVQFRESEGLQPHELSDEEVVTYLRHLQSLGVLDEFEKG